MNVLALDLGTKTGFAIWRDVSIISGTKKLQHNKNAFGLRFLNFRRWLIQTIQEHNIDAVYFERVHRHLGTEAAHVYGGFMYMLAAVCEEFNIECVGLPVCTIKKYATGNGHATKDEMIAFARSCGFNPIDDNEADALAILSLALQLIELKQKNQERG